MSNNIHKHQYFTTNDIKEFNEKISIKNDKYIILSFTNNFWIVKPSFNINIIGNIKNIYHYNIEDNVTYFAKAILYNPLALLAK